MTMATGSVLWYCHDHGQGHVGRVAAVLPHVRAPVVVAVGPRASTAALDGLGATVVRVPDDVPRVPCPTPSPWHHAPPSPEVRARGLALTDAIRRHHCTTAVVDVSMEVAAMARLLGLRVVAVRESGLRDDAAHHIGLGGADVVWVPQQRALEPLDAPPDDRWRFTGAFSRFDAHHPRRRSFDGERTVVFLVGGGGHRFESETWATACPPVRWRVVVAGVAGSSRHPRVTFAGQVEPVFDVLSGADVVVATAGWSSVADSVAAGSRLVVVPEPRPFHEQEVRARALAKAGLVVRLERWPQPCELDTVLQRAMALDPARWHAHYDRRGAVRAAAMIDEVHAK